MFKFVSSHSFLPTVTFTVIVHQSVEEKKKRHLAPFNMKLVGKEGIFPFTWLGRSPVGEHQGLLHSASINKNECQGTSKVYLYLCNLHHNDLKLICFPSWMQQAVCSAKGSC